MIICSNCKHQEILGALFCSECGTQLDVASGWITNAFDPPFSKTGAESPATELNGAPPAARLTLYLAANDASIHLDENGDFSLGRINEGQVVLPDIDLTPFDAFKHGVSRIHAEITLMDARVEIKDLGSSNGTRLNDRKLTPHVPYVLANGDTLLFGSLQASVLMRLPAV